MALVGWVPPAALHGGIRILLHLRSQGGSLSASAGKTPISAVLHPKQISWGGGSWVGCGCEERNERAKINKLKCLFCLQRIWSGTQPKRVLEMAASVPRVIVPRWLLAERLAKQEQFWVEAQKEHVTEVIKALNLLSQYVINIVQSKEIIMPKKSGKSWCAKLFPANLH